MWGSYPGEANGLTLMLDAEAFDVGMSKSPGAGLQIAIFYYLEVPIMSTGGINLDVGTFTKLGVSDGVDNEIRLSDVNRIGSLLPDLLPRSHV